MKKLVLATVSGLGLLALAACSEADNTSTQSVPPATETAPTTPAPSDPAVTPETPKTDETAPSNSATPPPANPAPAQ